MNDLPKIGWGLANRRFRQITLTSSDQINAWRSVSLLKRICPNAYFVVFLQLPETPRDFVAATHEGEQLVKAHLDVDF